MKKASSSWKVLRVAYCLSCCPAFSRHSFFASSLSVPRALWEFSLLGEKVGAGVLWPDWDGAFLTLGKPDGRMVRWAVAWVFLAAHWLRGR